MKKMIRKKKKIKDPEATVTLTEVRRRELEAHGPNLMMVWWDYFFDRGFALKLIIFLLGLSCGFIMFYLKYKPA